MPSVGLWFKCTERQVQKLFIQNASDMENRLDGDYYEISLVMDLGSDVFKGIQALLAFFKRC